MSKLRIPTIIWLKIIMKVNLTDGNITKGIVMFSIPLILTNLLQQLYNLADTIIVGRFLGQDALAAVGSASSFMTFITSIFLGLAMGAGAYISQCFGKGDEETLRKAKAQSFTLILVLTISIWILSELLLDTFISWLNIPSTIVSTMKQYMDIILKGLIATFLSSYYAAILRAISDSVTPLIFIGISALINIILDLFFIIKLNLGVAGAAGATVISQYIAGIGMMLFSEIKYKKIRAIASNYKLDKDVVSSITSLSILTSVQQSIMNLGILMVQGIVNTFGSNVMAAFAVAVKIDSIAYMPLQDFGNAFSTFIAQNFGAGKKDRIQKGIKSSLVLVAIFSITISLIIFVFSPMLMEIFIEDQTVVDIGTGYLRIEGAFYIGIGVLFMLYGYYRAVSKAGISVVLTIISLGLRVVLAHLLSRSSLGYFGIWLSVPIGWAMADCYGIIHYLKEKRKRI